MDVEQTRRQEELDELRRSLLEASSDDLVRIARDAHPHEIAEVWESLPAGRRAELVSALPNELAADVVSDLAPDLYAELIRDLPDEAAQGVLNELDPDDLADVLQDLLRIAPDQVERLRGLLRPHLRSVADTLTRYDEDEAGGIMTPEFVSVRTSMTAGQVIAFLRRASPGAETVYVLYVQDAEGRLAGVLSLRDLIIAPDDRPVGEMMTPDPIRVTIETDQEEVARLMADYDLSVLPVVDTHGHLVGIVTVDDIIDVIEDETTEDIHRLGAAPIDIDYPRTGPFRMYRKRLPWLGLLLVSMTLTFNVIAFYEDLLAEVVILAAFIPLLIDTGGNVGSQVATLVVRALATKDLGPRDYGRVLLKEIGTGSMLGVGLSVLVFLFVLLFRGEPTIALAIATTMILIVLVANTIGAGLPFIFRRLGIDPALTSSPVITTLMDVIGLLIYFQMVMLFLGS